VGQCNVPERHKGECGYGDVWTWAALCAERKLVPSWLVGERKYEQARAIMEDLKSRLANRVQIMTDGHSVYVAAVGLTFRGEVDWHRSKRSTARTPPANPPLLDRRPGRE
jgi:IS1 family transposase